LLGKLKEGRQLGKSSFKWDDNIKMDVKKINFFKSWHIFNSGYPNYAHLFLFLQFLMNINSKVSEGRTVSFFREAEFV